MTFTINVRLGGQCSAAPSTVLDQSLDRTRSAISGGSGMPAAKWRDVVVFKKALSCNAPGTANVQIVSFQSREHKTDGPMCQKR